MSAASPRFLLNANLPERTGYGQPLRAQGEPKPEYVTQASRQSLPPLFCHISGALSEPSNANAANRFVEPCRPTGLMMADAAMAKA